MRAGADRDVAEVTFDPNSARLSSIQPTTLAVMYDGSAVSVGLRGYSLEITFDDTYVFVDSMDIHVVEGSFLSDVGGTAFYVLPVDDNAFTVDCAILGATAGAMGTGDLCWITFKGRPSVEGVSVVEFTDVRLRDPDNNGILPSDGFAVLTLDNTPPNVPMMFPEPEFTQGTTNTVYWTDESASGAVGYCIEAAETPTFDVIVGTSGCTPFTQHTFTSLTDGQIYYYRVKCRDDVWNSSDWSASVYSTQDDTPPETEAGPLAPYYNTISLSIPFTAADATSGVQHLVLYYRKDGGVYTQYGSTYTTSPIAFTAPGEGVYDFYTIGTDNVGNVEAPPGLPDCTTEVDITPPPAIVDFTALPGHNKIHLSWTTPVGRDAPIEGTLLVRKPWRFIGAYPEYDDAVTPLGYPAHTSDGIVVAFIPGTGAQTYTDDVYTDAMRNIQYYTAFARDAAGNYSIAATSAQDRSTTYWLGDVDDPTGAPGVYDGYVSYYDKIVLSASYYTQHGEPHYEAEMDVGPTDDLSRFGIPLTDDWIEFEDLMIVAMNYGRVDPAWLTRGPVLAGGRTDGPFSLRLEPLGEEDGALDVALVLTGNADRVKGVSTRLSFDPTVLPLVSIEPSDGAARDDAFFYGAQSAPGELVADFALLGVDRSFTGSGTLAVLRFRTHSTETGRVEFTRGVLRDVRNATIDCELHGLDQDGESHGRRLRLAQNAPNPFNPCTLVSFEVPAEADVLLGVYDASGRFVCRLADGRYEPGIYRVTWDGRDSGGAEVASGVYFCSLESEGRRLTRKMVLMR